MLIEELLADLIRDEGQFKNSKGNHAVYKCPAGYWTIGYGIEVEQQGLSDDEARMLLRSRVLTVIDEVNKKLSWLITQPEPIRRVIYNMAYNLGMPRLKGFKNMLDALEKKDYKKAAIEAKDSLWYRQTKTRAERLVSIIDETDSKYFT